MTSKASNLVSLLLSLLLFLLFVSSQVGFTEAQRVPGIKLRSPRISGNRRILIIEAHPSKSRPGKGS